MIIDKSINIITIDGKTASKTLLAMGLKLATLLSASLWRATLKAWVVFRPGKVADLEMVANLL